MKPAHALDGIPDRLWTMVRVAPHRLLMLDYDGTLAPFRVERDEARPLPRTLELLRQIAATDHTSLAIVSGRPVREVERLVGPLRAQVVGEHGWEYRGPDGELDQRELDEAVAAALDEAERVGRSAGLQDHLERKRSAIVLHTRSLPAESAVALEERVTAAWQPLSTPGVVSLDRINGGLELRARKRDKGTVVLSLLSRAAPGTLGVFLGDDVTDEDAFEVVRDWGFGVRVGGAPRPTLAMGRIPTCEEVPGFLERWLATAGARAAGGRERPVRPTARRPRRTGGRS